MVFNCGLVFSAELFDLTIDYLVNQRVHKVIVVHIRILVYISICENISFYAIMTS